MLRSGEGDTQTCDEPRHGLREVVLLPPGHRCNLRVDVEVAGEPEPAEPLQTLALLRDVTATGRSSDAGNARVTSTYPPGHRLWPIPPKADVRP